MTDKERLIELLIDGHTKSEELPHYYGEPMKVDYQKFADYLLANGVAVLPCNYGDTVWFIKSAFSIMAKPIEAVVTSIRGISRDGTVRYMSKTLYNNIERGFTSENIGKTVFLTREEAERALNNLN